MRKGQLQQYRRAAVPGALQFPRRQDPIMAAAAGFSLLPAALPRQTVEIESGSVAGVPEPAESTAGTEAGPARHPHPTEWALVTESNAAVFDAQALTAPPVSIHRAQSERPDLKGASFATNWKRVEDRGQIACHRLKEARLYNGYTVLEAAERLAMDAKDLADIESGVPPAMAVLVAAREVYLVPFDYLLGFVDEEEAGGIECKAAALRDQIVATFRENIQCLGDFMQERLAAGAPSVAMARDLISSGEKVLAALERFKARNPDFEEMPAGALLISAAAALWEDCRIAKAAVHRFDTLGPEAMARERRRLSALAGDVRRAPGVPEVSRPSDSAGRASVDA